MSDCNETVTKKRERSLKTNLVKWKREVTKRKRMSEDAYIGYSRHGNKVGHDTNRSKRTMKATCSSKKCQSLKNRFCQLLDEDMRENIFNKYWSAIWEDKKTFVTTMVINTSRKRDSTGLGNESRRSNTFFYFLKYDHSECLQVCKTMFLNTLGLNEWMVRNWVNTAVHGLPGKINKVKLSHSIILEWS